LQKKRRIIFKKLDVVLKDTEAVAKLVRITRDSLIAGNVLRHVHQTLVRDGRKHIDAERGTRDRGLELWTEIRLKPRKGVPGFHEIQFRFLTR
jgi:hypothetical protein